MSNLKDVDLELWDAILRMEKELGEHSDFLKMIESGVANE